MPNTRVIRIQPSDDATMAQGVAQIQRELRLPTAFPAEVEDLAARAAANPRLPALDRSDIPLLTIDPPGSMDLDQAMHLERRDGDGYRVYYALADVAAFVTAGDAIDDEAHRRGETLYGGLSTIPLHPTVLCENAASLLPGKLRPSILWTIDLDRTGEIVAIDVRRARVRSRQQCDYPTVQQQLDAGRADPVWDLLREIGQRRQALEKQRGGVSLSLPDAEIGCDGGQWDLEYRLPLPVEDWNAQISLLTGMAAAKIMLQGKVGIVRTLPPPDAHSLARLRLGARALRIDWPDTQPYPDFIRTLDPSQPHHVAMMFSCTAVLRGAGYAAFDGQLPAQPLQAAIAAPYAHVTAPMRRLVDRHANEACVALCAGAAVPDWVRSALPGLVETMATSDRRAHQYERAIIDLAQAVILAPRVGQPFAGAIVEVRQASHGADGAGARTGIVMLRDPPLEAHVESATALELGGEVTVRLAQADPASRSVRFVVAD